MGPVGFGKSRAGHGSAGGSARPPERVRVEGDLYHPKVPVDAVYVGRQGVGLRRSPYANPFSVREYGRAEALERYERWLTGQPGLVARARLELRGRALACWCRTTDPCHADILLRLANDETALPHAEAPDPNAGAALLDTDAERPHAHAARPHAHAARPHTDTARPHTDTARMEAKTGPPAEAAPDTTAPAPAHPAPVTNGRAAPAQPGEPASHQAEASGPTPATAAAPSDSGWRW